MRIEIVIIPDEVEELIVKIGSKERPATWDDLNEYHETIDFWLLSLRNHNFGKGYTPVYLTSDRSTLTFENGLVEIEGEEIAREDILSRLESIKESCGNNVPLAAIRIGSEDSPASEKDIHELIGEIKVPFTAMVSHHAVRFYVEKKD